MSQQSGPYTDFNRDFQQPRSLQDWGRSNSRSSTGQRDWISYQLFWGLVSSISFWLTWENLLISLGAILTFAVKTESFKHQTTGFHVPIGCRLPTTAVFGDALKWMQERLLQTRMDQILPNPLLRPIRGRLTTSYDKTSTEKVWLNTRRINHKNRSN